MSANSPKQTRKIVRAVIGFVLFLLFVPVLLFISAGTMDWPMAWVYVILFLASTLSSRLIVLKRNPDTLQERARFTASQGTPSWDRILFTVNGIAGMSALVVAGLDHRFGWSAIITKTGQVLAALVVAAGHGLGDWAMVVNRFFSAVARIQQDRGQKVVTTGPYRIMRHPAYAGAILASMAMPVMLDALWSMVPTAIMVAAIVIRTRLEDGMLKAELDGYQSYAEETRYRLMPGLW
jgi:protein-S-isoprenylcysteine O-methyltransferase Ste14